MRQADPSCPAGAVGSEADRLAEFTDFRKRMNERILAEPNQVVRRFFALDTQTYEAGAMDVKTKEMLGQLKKGDRVMTSGGIYGTVAQVEDQIVWVKLADTLKVKMAKSAITSVVADSETGKDQGGAA